MQLKSKKIPGEQSVNVEEQRAKRNRHVLKMAIAIVLGFVLCWLPWSTIKLLIMFAWDGRLPCGKILFWSISNVMSASNCAINPCICFFFSGNYQQGLKRLLAVFVQCRSNFWKLALFNMYSFTQLPCVKIIAIKMKLCPFLEKLLKFTLRNRRWSSLQCMILAGSFL